MPASIGPAVLLVSGESSVSVVMLVRAIGTDGNWKGINMIKDDSV